MKLTSVGFLVYLNIDILILDFIDMIGMVIGCNFFGYNIMSKVNIYEIWFKANLVSC